MSTYTVTVRTAARTYPPYTAIAATSAQAGEDARNCFDEPCGITVMPTATAQ